MDDEVVDIVVRYNPKKIFKVTYSNYRTLYCAQKLIKNISCAKK